MSRRLSVGPPAYTHPPHTHHPTTPSESCMASPMGPRSQASRGLLSMLGAGGGSLQWPPGPGSAEPLPCPSFFLPSLSPGPQGDGNIRYYEISTEKPYLSYLMEFRSPAPQKGLGKGAPGLPRLLHYERRDWNLALGSPLPHSEKSASVMTE